jgi:hypothetical protein
VAATLFIAESRRRMKTPVREGWFARFASKPGYSQAASGVSCTVKKYSSGYGDAVPPAGIVTR